MTQPVSEKEWTRIAIPQTDEEAFYGIPNKEPFMPVENGYGFEGVLLQNFAGEDGNKVQCHICGKWFGCLAIHIKKHGYSSINDYKDDYGFFQNTALVSEKLRLSRVSTAKENVKKGLFRSYPNIFTKNSKHKRRALHFHKKAQFANAHNTCRMQILFRLKNIAEQLGKPNISCQDLQAIGEQRLLQAIYHKYTSFNNAKKLANLDINKSTKKLTKIAIVNSIILFKEQYQRLPTQSDFRRGLLICSSQTIYRKFGSPNNAFIAAGFEK